MRTLVAIGVVIAITFGSFPSDVPAQEGTAEQIGERIDRGLEQLGREVRKKWGEIRQSINELGVQGRVYSRLRWDKAIATESIDIEVQEKNVVVLTGVVRDEETRRRAVRLAGDTVGVGEVVDRLQIDSSRRERSTTRVD
ncbi:MAG: BON domain-containing protein [Pirellulales bacterium]